MPRLSTRMRNRGAPDPSECHRAASPEATAALHYLAGDADAAVRNAVATVLEAVDAG